MTTKKGKKFFRQSDPAGAPKKDDQAKAVVVPAPPKKPHPKRGQLIGVTGKGQRGHAPQCLACLVVLCFESRCPEPNAVARLRSTICPLPKFWPGYATGSAAFPGYVSIITVERKQFSFRDGDREQRDSRK